MSAPWSAWPARAPSADFASRVAQAAGRDRIARRRRARVAIGAVASLAAAAAIALVWPRRAPRVVVEERAAAVATIDPPIGPDGDDRIGSRVFDWPTAPDWDGPRFAFPLPFAPSLPYHGGVVLHTAPEFDRRGTPDYWSYVDVWLLEERARFAPDDLRRDLQAYFTGLCGTNSHPGTHTRADVPREATATIAPAPLDAADRAPGVELAVRGEILAPLCALTGSDLRLHVEGIAGACDDGGAFVAYALSPMPDAHPIWSDLRRERRAFHCARR